MSRAQLLLVRIGLGVFMLVTLQFSYRALIQESAELELTAEHHLNMIESKREKTRLLKSQVHMLEREIAHLKVDSELSSLLARTILGVVLPSESVYQLSTTGTDQREFEP